MLESYDAEEFGAGSRLMDKLRAAISIALPVEPAQPLTLVQALNFFSLQERQTLWKEFTYSDNVIATMTRAVLTKQAASAVEPVEKCVIELIAQRGGDTSEPVSISLYRHRWKAIAAALASTSPQPGAVEPTAQPDAPFTVPEIVLSIESFKHLRSIQPTPASKT